jgi:hypothetical protein
MYRSYRQRELLERAETPGRCPAGFERHRKQNGLGVCNLHRDHPVYFALGLGRCAQVVSHLARRDAGPAAGPFGASALRKDQRLAYHHGFLLGASVKQPRGKSAALAARPFLSGTPPSSRQSVSRPRCGSARAPASGRPSSRERIRPWFLKAMRALGERGCIVSSLNYRYAARRRCPAEEKDRVCPVGFASLIKR